MTRQLPLKDIQSFLWFPFSFIITPIAGPPSNPVVCVICGGSSSVTWLSPALLSRFDFCRRRRTRNTLL
ncbi:uncharacterized protein B0T23DRAFT_383196 [Neurospora hispaniola]|uniref:Uncharacterized protein n=1 Tax=Neurospora hispaniola TaxID=588809 RepID=A0AAJ0MQQ6_9PEZI|nr:hypothetical protein B0T23DRAFT_383196 [Neurospora hispaniola]